MDTYVSAAINIFENQIKQLGVIGPTERKKAVEDFMKNNNPLLITKNNRELLILQKRILESSESHMTHTVSDLLDDLLNFSEYQTIKHELVEYELNVIRESVEQLRKENKLLKNQD